MVVRVKICGLSTEAGVQAAVAAGADYAGFVHFAGSPRHLPLERAAALAALLPEDVKSVLVAVEPDDELASAIVDTLRPDYLQLHGKETPERVAAIKATLPPDIKIIKAIPISSADDVAGAMRYVGPADMLLFDAKPPRLPGMLPGGNGLAFDWALLADRNFSLPWVLSGGLNAGNAGEAIRISGAATIDVSSGVESAPGVKDPLLIDAFLKAARNA